MSKVVDMDRFETGARTAIVHLYESCGIVPSATNDFSCPFLKECSQSVSQNLVVGQFETEPTTQNFSSLNAGTWPYVGHEYGSASVRGKVMKILFVAMERGGTYHPSLEATFAHTQNSFREACISSSNPHMGGVAQILKFLLDKEESTRFSYQFALTNAVKCVVPTGNQNSGYTRCMIANCATHLKAELETLRPSLVITQGDHPSTTVLGLFPLFRADNDFSDRAGKATVWIGGGPFVLLTTPHPARKSGWSWKRGELPTFLQDAVAHASLAVNRDY